MVSDPQIIPSFQSDRSVFVTRRIPEAVDREFLEGVPHLRGIAGAGLDVFENESELAPGLAELENVVLAPHTGSATLDTRSRMAVIAATNALYHLRGERAPNVVNPEVYESAPWRVRVGEPDV